MTSMMHALDAYQQSANDVDTATSRTSMPKGLSVEEVFGNIFIINFAGHDTTASALAFAMLLLASRPSVQRWLAEEIRHVTQDTSPDKWTYEAVFERLVRCKAVLVSLTSSHIVAVMLTLFVVRNAAIVPSHHGSTKVYQRADPRH